MVAASTPPWQAEGRDSLRGYSQTASALVRHCQRRRYLYICGSGLDWKSIKNGGVVVDLGGGIGSVTLILAKAFPHLRYVVQDLDNVIIEAHKVSCGPHLLFFLLLRVTLPLKPLLFKFWKTTYPDAVATGLVSLQSQWSYVYFPYRRLITIQPTISSECNPSKTLLSTSCA